MSVKSQLNSTREVLMAGLRASARVPRHNSQTEQIIQACLDMVETMARRPAEVAVNEVEITLSVMNKAVSELDDDTTTTKAVVSSMQNAIGRLQGVRAELGAR